MKGKWILKNSPLLEKFCPLSNILPSWGPFCPECSSFCPLSSSGQEKGCFGVGFGAFCVRTYPQKGFVLLNKEQGLVVIFWAKWDLIWAKWEPYGQLVWKVGKNLQNWRKKIQSCRVPGLVEFFSSCKILQLIMRELRAWTYRISLENLWAFIPISIPKGSMEPSNSRWVNPSIMVTVPEISIWPPERVFEGLKTKGIWFFANI